MCLKVFLIATRTLAAMVCCLIFSLAAAAQTLTIGNPQSNFDLPTGLVKTSFSISIKADAATLANLIFPDTIPEYVQVGTNSDEKFRKAVTYHFDKASANLNVKVESAALTAQGSYTVSIRYTFGKDNTIGHLPFTLNKGNATLESVNTVTITKIGPEIQHEQVVLRETSNKTSAAGLHFSDPYLPGANGTGLIIFREKTYEAPTGEVKTIDYQIDTDKLRNVPLGTTTGKMYVNSPSLTAPVPITFVVNHRVWPGWIVVMVFAGLGLSYLVKQVLAEQKDNEGVRLSGYRLISDIREFGKPIKGLSFTKRLSDCEREITSVIDSTYSATATDTQQAMTLIQQQRTEFLKIKKEFYDAINGFQTRFHAFEQVVYDKDLSSLMLWYLSKAHDPMDTLFQAIKDSDTAKATDLEGKVKEAIASAADRYKSYFAGVKTALSDPANFPDHSTGTQNAAKTKLDAVDAALGLIVLDPQDPAKSIAPLNSQQVILEELGETLTSTLKNDYTAANLPYADDDALGQAAVGWIGQVNQVLTNAGHAGDAAAYPFAGFVKAVNDAAAAKAAGAAQTDEEEALGFDHGRETIMAEQNFTLPDGLLPDGQPDFNFGNPLKDPGSIDILLNRAREKYWVLSLVQTVVLALLISFGAYSSLKATFVGTVTDFIGVLLLGFSMDIVVSNVAQFKIKTP